MATSANVNAQLMGTATDAGTVGGIDRVEVYLVNVAADQVINLATGGLVAKDPSPDRDPGTTRRPSL